MNFVSRLWNKIKNPHGIWLVLFYIVFLGLVAGTIVLIVLQPQQTALNYILYTIAAIGLTYFVYTIVYLAPRMKQEVINILSKYKFTKAMLTSFGYRTLIFGIFSFVVNISYVAFQGVLAFMTKSAWYISITAYYLVLSLMKGNIFYSKWKFNNATNQARNYKFCGIMLILLTVAFSGMIVLIYTSNMYFEYAGLLIYAVAAYTFYKLTLSIINLFKARKQDDLYVQSIRNINLVSAIVSIMVLQVAMFQAFSPSSNISPANAVTGGAVGLLILTIGITMIIQGNKILNINKGGNIDERQQ